MKWLNALKQAASSRNRELSQTRPLRILLVVFVCLLVAGVFLLNVVFTELGERFGLAFDLTANAPFQKLVMVLLMWLGRLEVYAIASLFAVSFWRR